jgi:phage terminase large subunit
MVKIWRRRLELELPDLLNVPEKLRPLITEINNYRYFLIDGGRASGKTQSIARLIAYLCEKQSIRVVCGRETQNSIEESVYTVFADLVRTFNLNFNVSASKIDHKVTKSAIRFRGFREQGATNIKGLEGVDILWVDESQAISKQTMDVILPTIRKENSKIIWSMNRLVENDPVYTAMAGRPDCLHIHIDYNENPFCPQKMIDEANLCKARSEEDFNHIWLGQPLKQGDDFVFSSDTVYTAHKNEFVTSGTKKRILAVDVARFGEDETVFSVVESRGMFHWEQIHQEHWKARSTMECVGKVVDLVKTMAIDVTVIDDTGVGGGVTDRLQEMMIKVLPFIGAEKAMNNKYTNARSEAFFNLADMFFNKHIKIIDDPILKEQLLTVRYKFKSNGTKGIVSKDEMKSDGVKSPDRADSLAMALYFKSKPFIATNVRRRNVEPVPLARLI